MRFFVASWFFPPSTSSEGIVAYKLLKSSKHTYEVCSAISDQWGYTETIDMNASNIKQFLVKTDSIDSWVEQAIEIFEREHAANPYNGIMTRSMPPESIEVAKAIKAKHPDLPWIASLGDPLARIPWMTKGFLTNNRKLSKSEKRALREALAAPRFCDEWIDSENAGVRALAQYKNWEMEALKNADLVITPSAPQLTFMLCGMRRKNALAIGHSYDSALYPKIEERKADKKAPKELVFLGYASDERTLVPFIEALHILQLTNPDALTNLKVRLIGNIADDSASLVYNYYLNDVVSIEGNVSYEDSLAIMQQADWLLHTDAHYKEFAFSGGSVYFAGKLADYLGSGKPILAVTGKNSPADRIIKQAGGLSFQHREKQELAAALEKIANDTLEIEVCTEYREQFTAAEQAKKLDEALDIMLQTQGGVFERKAWPPCKASQEHKLLSICVPAYNVQAYLDRCLLSLIESGVAEQLEVLVINDGSTDTTKDIALAYQSHYPGIMKLVNKENGGHGSTINTAIDVASGEYFRVLDGDDWLDPSYLKKFVTKLQELKEPVDLISSDYVQIDINTGKLNPKTKKSGAIDYGRIYSLDSVDFTNEYFSMGSITYRTEVVRESGLRILEHVSYADVEYQMMVLPWVHSVMFLPGKLYHYAVGNSEQSISRTSFVNRYDHHDKIMKRVIRFYCDHRAELPQNVRDYYENLIVNHLLRTHYTISLLFDNDRNRGYQRAKEFDSYLNKHHHDLYVKVGETYPTVSEARKHNFDPDQCQKATTLFQKQQTKLQSIARSGARKVMRGGVGTIIASEVNKRRK